jgi:hypothetical protein
VGKQAGWMVMEACPFSNRVNGEEQADDDIVDKISVSWVSSQ